ncbi:MAG TPA: NYN domain-containing protein [Azospira sp.]|nr:NYN domain-containing protein [Azospira sp.]
MAAPADTVSMALFCDFENIALGVRDAQYDKFDIKPVLERLLVKGSIVVKKAYCDWERYKGFKATMHEANFELIEIPHVRQSGKNSADIRLVVDALDLCYTKSHVDTFVIISGDSDFSPLVSKLRENAKHVIGVGVKQSTSDLLIANCDEFIFYDDLVRDREAKRGAARRDTKEAAPKRSPEDEKKRREDQEARRTKGIELAMATFEDLMAERSESEKLWASVLKEAIKRRNPGFNESYYGFRAFGNLLEEAQNRGLLAFGRDEKSSAYVARPGVAQVQEEPLPVVEEVLAEAVPAPAEVAEAAEVTASPAREGRGGNRRRGRSREGGDRSAAAPAAAPVTAEVAVAAVEAPVAPSTALVAEAPETQEVAAPVEKAASGRRRGRGGRGAAEAAAPQAEAPVAPAPTPVVESAPAPQAPASARSQGGGARSGARTRARKAAAAQEFEAAKAAVAKAPAPVSEAAPAASEVPAKPSRRRAPAKRGTKKAAAAG